MILFENNMFNLYQEENDIYIQLNAQNVTLGDINEVIKDFPRIRIYSFVELQMILNDNIFEKIRIGDFALNRKQTLAQGIQPIAGKDAKYKYFQLSEGRPELKADGKVDLYEMNLIDNVAVGDWLGEKTKPLPGIPGQTVLGREIPAKAGRDYQMKFDPKSVLELEEGGKVLLRAKKEGAVRFENGRIMVHNHLVILFSPSM